MYPLTGPRLPWVALSGVQGSNNYGQMGSGSTSPTKLLVPTAVSGTWSKLPSKSAESSHVCAVKTDASLW